MSLQSIALRAEMIGREYFAAHPDFPPVILPSTAREMFPSVLEREAFKTGFTMARWAVWRAQYPTTR